MNWKSEGEHAVTVKNMQQVRHNKRRVQTRVISAGVCVVVWGGVEFVRVRKVMFQ